MEKELKHPLPSEHIKLLQELQQLKYDKTAERLEQEEPGLGFLCQCQRLASHQAPAGGFDIVKPDGTQPEETDCVTIVAGSGRNSWGLDRKCVFAPNMPKLGPEGNTSPWPMCPELRTNLWGIPHGMRDQDIEKHHQRYWKVWLE